MKISEYIELVRKDKERKNSVKIIKELIYCGLIEKEIPYYYFTNLLYKKDADNYKNYIGFKKGHNIINNFYLPHGRNPEVENKIQFYKIANKNGIRTPRILAENQGKNLTRNSSTILIESPIEFSGLIDSLLKESKSGGIFIKPIDGVGGRESFKIKNVNDASVETVYNLLHKINFIFQENVNQDDKINKIYSKSVNTLRLHAYKKQGNVEVISALMRFGHSGSVVDNASAGGFFIPVDLKTFRLVGKGKKFLNQGGESYVYHPDSNVILNGFQLPYKNEVINLVEEATKYFNSNFVGWDVALTPNGPVIIEGNDGPHIFMLQMACGGIKSHPEYRDIFKKYI